MKKVITLLLLLLFSLSLFAQQSSITLTAPGPTPVSGINARVVGNGGPAAYYYWAIANWPIGKSQAVGTYIINVPNTLTGSNYVQLSWNRGSATSVDILRTTTPYIPASCNCALATSYTAGSISDTGAVLSTYTFMPVGSATATIRLDNSSFTQPTLYVNVPYNSVKLASLPSAASSKGLTYLVVDASNSSNCNTGGGLNTPALCWSDGSTWIAIGGGSGSSVSTPFIVTNLGNISGPITLHQSVGNQIFVATVTGNVTLTSADAGATSLFQTVFTSDGTHTVTCDSTFVFCAPLDNTVGVTTVQTFSWSGTSGLATPTLGTNGSGAYIVLPDGTRATFPSTGPATSGWTYGLASAKPATCAVSQMYFATDATAGQNWYYCTSPNTWTQQLNSGGGGSVVLDCSNVTSNRCISEPFCPGSLGNLQIGALGWSLAVVTGTITNVTDVADHWCGYNLNTGSAANTSSTLSLASLGIPPMNAEGVTAQYFYKFHTPVSLTDTLIEIGMGGTVSSGTITDAGGKDVAVRYLNDGGTDCNGSTFVHGTDATWIYYLRNGATTQTSTGPAIVADTDYILRISTGTSGSIGFSMNTAGSPLPADTILNTVGAIPTTAMTPIFKVATCNTTQKVLPVYSWNALITHW